jgi:lipid-binding SYLF domain-containing protein
MCVLVFPSVKKVAIGIGGSYGRGVLVCRKGTKMDGSWGAPVMYALDQGSLGIQLGSTAAMTSDVLTYSRSKGLFAGVSLEGASMDTDNDANKKLYGKEIGAKEIVTGGQAVVPAAEPLVNLLDKSSPNRK